MMGPKTILPPYTADHFQFCVIHSDLHSLSNIHDVTFSSTFGNLGKAIKPSFLNQKQGWVSKIPGKYPKGVVTSASSYVKLGNA